MFPYVTQRKNGKLEVIPRLCVVIEVGYENIRLILGILSPLEQAFSLLTQAQCFWTNNPPHFRRFSEKEGPGLRERRVRRRLLSGVLLLRLPGLPLTLCFFF